MVLSEFQLKSLGVESRIGIFKLPGDSKMHQDLEL